MGEVTSVGYQLCAPTAQIIPVLGIAPGQCRTNKTRAKGPIYALSMPESHAFVLIHIVFSTKNRIANLNAEIRPPLHAYLATVARNLDCVCYRVGGVADHVHLAIRLSRTSTIVDLVQALKPRRRSGSRRSRRRWHTSHGKGAMERFPSGLRIWGRCRRISIPKTNTIETVAFKRNIWRS
jgi:REP element-mobilizing transposase RayT